MSATIDDRGQALFEALRAKARQVIVDGQTFWRVEGDLLLDEEQLRSYARQQAAVQAAREEARAAGRPLVATTEIESAEEGGRIVRWSPGKELTYAVLRKTFTIGGSAGYKLAIECMRKATVDWEATCGIRFRHRPEEDESDARIPENVVFIVRELDTQGALIAAAFFPNDPVSRRRVVIDPSFYSLNADTFDRVGVLRHELGHVLGFRHEHIRSEAPPGCSDEDTYGTIDLTKYDPSSVMHYFCGGVGTRELRISEQDRIGAQKTYGPPLAGFRFVD